MKTLPKKSKKQRGSSLVEYALLVAFIAANAVAAVKVVGQRSAKSFGSLESEISGASVQD